MERKIKAMQFHLAKASHLLDDVRVLMEHGRYTSIISRLYYACFHAATALLLTKDITSKTHKGLQVLLQQQFVKPKILDPSLAKFFARLYEERLEDDYGDSYIADQEDVTSYIEPATHFVTNIKNLIHNYVTDQH